MKFKLLNTPCFQKTDYITLFAVGGIGDHHKHFERLLTRAKTTHSGYNRFTGLTINQKYLGKQRLINDTGSPSYRGPTCFTCRNCGGGDRGRVAIYRPFGEVSLSLNRTVTCMVLKANDRRTSCPCHDEFRGPRSDYVRQVALATTKIGCNKMMHIKSIEAFWPLVGMVWKFGMKGVNSSVVLVTCLWFKITRSVTNSSRTALEGDVN
ncbi:uncharacterized protein TNCV_3397741 [Trichonephila clavipes]|nr:uncharacterized protein TNCV_3397741 [Trichonephila clavipes]